jgi:multidrug efflux system membrane fusion protein
MDEPTLLRLRRSPPKSLPLGLEGAKPLAGQNGGIKVVMALQGETGFPLEGVIDFFNNQLNPTTNSLSVRALFSNPKPPNGVRLLSPGMFARIRVPLSEPHPAVVVADQAIDSSQGLRYVYVIDKDNKAQYRAQYRRVSRGPEIGNGLRVILPGTRPDEGLKPGDWIVTGNLQQVKPKLTTDN